jgi:hypothetical protein
MGRDVRYIGSSLRLDLPPGRKDDPWKKKQYPKQSRQSVAHRKLYTVKSSQREDYWANDRVRLQRKEGGSDKILGPGTSGPRSCRIRTRWLASLISFSSSLSLSSSSGAERPESVSPNVAKACCEMSRRDGAIRVVPTGRAGRHFATASSRSPDLTFPCRRMQSLKYLRVLRFPPCPPCDALPHATIGAWLLDSISTW